MNIQNIKKMKSERGFTIVELLIVIVVIGILAAIVIVAYNGVQNKAKTTKNQTNASSVQKAAEAYNADNGAYPVTLATLIATTNSAPVPTTVTVVSGGASDSLTALTAAQKATTVQYDITGSGTGARIRYWDFAASTPGISANVIYLGTATSGSTFAAAS